jgi:hypothetical protein
LLSLLRNAQKCHFTKVLTYLPHLADVWQIHAAFSFQLSLSLSHFSFQLSAKKTPGLRRPLRSSC